MNDYEYNDAKQQHLQWLRTEHNKAIRELGFCLLEKLAYLEIDNAGMVENTENKITNVKNKIQEIENLRKSV